MSASAADGTTDGSETPGRIFTFYSYKGGTGRTMLLANLAWLLAMEGQRVLMIDWDLEAPGLHRYFHPFLKDPELVHARGIVDWVADARAAAIEAERGPIAADDSDAASNDDTEAAWTSVQMLTGHADWVQRCAVALDGTWLATTSRDHTIRIWNTTTWHSTHTLTDHTDWVQSCSVAPDGTWLATTSRDHTIRIWNTTTWKCTHTLTDHTEPVVGCAIVPDGTWLATTSGDHTIRIWDTTTWHSTHTLTDHTDWVRSCSVAPDGTWLATTSDDHTIRIWDTTTWKCTHTLTDHTEPVVGCAIAPDGTWLATTSGDHTIRIWSTGQRARPTSVDVDAERRTPADPWWADFTTLAAYAEPIEHEFAGGGLIELVPAGRQDAGYAARVNDTDWASFYEELGGGVILEELRDELRDEYDYVLIDSRTGIADSAGICTVHLPDELVVCFTLNRQSTVGAAAVATSAEAQRRAPDGAPTLRVWPVPTRIDPGEKERVDAARVAGRREFDHFLNHLPRKERRPYWGQVEVLHQSYYAFEEILAVIADSPDRSATIRHAVEQLARRITGLEISTTEELSEEERHHLVDRYLRQEIGPSTVAQFFLGHTRADRSVAETLVEQMRAAELAVWWSGDILLGDQWDQIIDRNLANADIVLVVVGAEGLSRHLEAEVARAAELDKRVVPLMLSAGKGAELPDLLAQRQALLLDSGDATAIEKAVRQLAELAARLAPSAPAFDLEDPQKGRWGGLADQQGRRLTAAVRPLRDDWFETAIRVERTGGNRLVDDVSFYLPPEYRSPQVATPIDGVASVTVQGWGAFTVGATTDGGRVHLELDLSTLEDAPPIYRER